MNTNPSSALSKIAIAVAAAAVVGGGGAVLRASETNAVQDQRLENVESSVAEVKELRKELAEVNKNLAVTNTLLKGRTDEPRN